MKALVIITSAIMVDGHDVDLRLMQTLHTIDSIKLRIPNSEIWLCDSSTKPLPNYMLNSLTGVKLIPFYNDNKIHSIKDYSNNCNLPAEENIIEFYRLGLLKNLTEIYVLNTIFSKIDPSKYDRIFKISGRYFLTDDFNLEKHNNYGKINLTKLRKSRLEKFTESKYFRTCVTYNFCTSLFNEIKESFLNIEKYIQNKSKNNGLADIEHGLALFIPDDIIHQIDLIGICGKVNSVIGGMHYE